MAVSPSTARKLTEVVVPPSLDSLFGQISTTLDQKETRDVIHELKRLYPTKADSFDQTDLYGALKQLYVLGVIDDGGDQKMLEILAGKILKNEEIMKLLDGYKQASSSRKDDFIGRDDDEKNLIKLVMDPRVPGVNVFGESGVGKTTFAIEVSKKLAKNENYVPFIVDLRGTKDINTVYFKVLETFQLTPWDYSKERIYTHLKQHLETKILLILDNIEQFLSYENEADEKRRNEFLSFLRTIMSSEASQRESLKVILTSRKKIDDPMLEDTGFQQKELKPLTEKASRQLMSGRIRDETADDEQDKALVKIADLCRNTPYLLERAEQLLRQNFSKPSKVLEKLNTIKNKGVPERFACISALFDSLPSDDLRRVAVQISLFQRSFSVSTAMKIAEFSSEYDAEHVLELLATQKIITAKDVNGERKYDLHALFREFVTSYLCKDPVYQDVYDKAENQFAEHFSKRFIQLAKNLDKDFVGTYEELQEDKANLELSIDLATRKETLDLILQSDDVKETGSVAILFEAFKSVKERRKLFGEWAKIMENKGHWLSSAKFRCWESIQLADMERTQTACEALKKAETSLGKAMSIRTPQEVSAVKGLCKYCSGQIKYMSSANLIDESRKLEKEHLLKQSLFDLKQSLAIHKKVYGDHTRTARTLNLIGNCYMECDKPKEALKFYQQAMDMKIKLVGSEKHFDIPTYYNQLSQVYEILGKEETSWSFQSIANRIWSWISQEKRQNYDKAVEYLEKALTLRREMGVNDTADTATFQRNLANILLGLGEYGKALDYAQKSFKIRNANLGEHPETVRILYLIGVIHEWRKDHKAALHSYEEAFVMEESLPEDNRGIVRKLLCERLEEMCKKLNKEDKLKDYESRMDKIRKETERDAEERGAAAKKTDTASGEGEAAAVKTDAASGEGGAAAQKTDAGSGEGDAATKKTDAASGEGDAAAKKTDAGSGEGDAAAKKTDAASGEGDAATKKTDAGSGEGDAATKKTDAGSGEGGAATKKTDAASGEGDAATKKTDTASREGDAATKETDAASGERGAATKMTDAASGEGDAATKKTDAASGEGDAATKKTDAGSGEGDASAKKTDAASGEGDASAKKTEASVGEENNVITLDDKGGYYDFSKDYFFLKVPPNAVNTPIKVKYKVDPCCQPPMAGITTSVSYFLEMSSSMTEELNEPVTVTLMHSGPGKDYGYETTVMAFNQHKYVWEELEELRQGSRVSNLGRCKTDFIQVRISKFTILAVVTRLITDRFQVTPKGCVVKSSVCDDVTIEFPEGAVEKNTPGSMKLLLMAQKYLENDEYGYPCPILLVDGFEGVSLHKPITITKPHPCPTKYPMQGKMRLMRLPNEPREKVLENKWEDITDKIFCKEIMKDQKCFVELQVQHFSWLWLLGCGTLVTLPILPTIFRDLISSPPLFVRVGLFKAKDELPVRMLKAFKVTLRCVANHDDRHMREMEETYERLAIATSRNPMHSGDIAFVTVEGGFEERNKEEEHVVRFLKDEKFDTELNVCRKWNDDVQDRFDRNRELIISLYTNEMDAEPVCILSTGETEVVEAETFCNHRVYIKCAKHPPEVI